MNESPASPPVAPASHDAFLTPNRYVDSDHPAVVAFARAHGGDDPDPVARAVALYYAIRDGWRYNPWNVHFDKASYAASAILARDRSLGAHCIDKALVLAAGCRVFGIPSRLHFADVRNHIGTARLEERLGTDLLVFHGYTEIFLNGRWVAATPAFNRALCEKLGVDPLEFDGQTDSIFQEFRRKRLSGARRETPAQEFRRKRLSGASRETPAQEFRRKRLSGASRETPAQEFRRSEGEDPGGVRFMEYVTDHGTHPGVPFDDMVAAWKQHYRPLAENGRWPEPS